MFRRLFKALEAYSQLNVIDYETTMFLHGFPIVFHHGNEESKSCEIIKGNYLIVKINTDGKN